MSTFDEHIAFATKLPDSPKWEKFVEADEKAAAHSQTRRKYALNALISVSAFTSVGLVVGERCVEHGILIFLPSFVFWYLLFMVTVASCEVGIGESNPNQHHHKIFNDISKITSGLGSLLSCGFFLRFTEFFLRNALAVSAGIHILIENASPRTLCLEENDCFALSSQKNCSSREYGYQPSTECRKLAILSLLVPPTLRLTQMMTTIDENLFTNPIPSWVVMVAVVLACLMGAALRPLIVRCPKFFFMLSFLLQIVFGALLFTLAFLLDSWPEVSFKGDFRFLRFCFDGIAMASSALCGLLVEFGTVMPTGGYAKLKGFFMALVSLFYTLVVAIFSAIGYLAEAQSVGNSHVDPVIVWPIWTKHRSHGDFVVVATLLLFLLGSLSATTLLSFYPLTGVNKPSSWKFYVKLLPVGLVIAIVGLGGVRATRVVERSADFVTAVAIQLQLIILLIARATGGRIFNKQITEGSNVFGNKRGWRQALVPFNLFISFLLALLIFLSAVYRVVEPVPPGLWQKTLDPVGSHYVAEVLLHLLPVILFCFVTVIRVLLLSKNWGHRSTKLNLDTVVSDYC
ncbi:unnamed protein product, partial [Mesorhabditis belari]|uniref:Uncharacterized protein n=1 Tax=Mesorhabditis belari TaxID=2138241 RepID=A0AAF3EFE1_9BILA